MNRFFYICALFLCLFHISTCQNILVNYNAPEKNIDYPGNDVANKIVNNASACAAECDKPEVKNCVGFIYYNETFSGMIYNQQATVLQGACYLKSSMKNTYTFPSNANMYAYKSSLRSSADKIYIYWKAVMLASLITISSSYLLFI